MNADELEALRANADQLAHRASELLDEHDGTPGDQRAAACAQTSIALSLRELCNSIDFIAGNTEMMIDALRSGR
jgi:hypothetical protein